MHQYLKALYLYILKILLGSTLAVLVISALLSLETGIPVLDFLISNSGDSYNTIESIISGILGKLPFLGYLLDSVSLSGILSFENGFTIFHEFIKTILFFVITNWSYSLLVFYITKFKTVANEMLFLEYISNIYLYAIFTFTSAWISVLLYDFIVSFWFSVFSNDLLGNLLLFILMILLFIANFFLVPSLRRNNLVHNLTSMLIDFGFIVCGIALLFTMLFVYRYPITGAPSISTYLTLTIFTAVFSIIGFCILLYFKQRRK